MRKSEAGRDNYAQAAEDARALFLRYDQTALVEKFGLEADAAYLYIRFFNVLYRIDRRTAAVGRQCQAGFTEPCSYNEVMSIYDALCYPETRPTLAGRWCTVASLPGAAHASLLEDRMCGGYAPRFDRQQAQFVQACEALGGQKAPFGDIGYRFSAFPFLPLILRFYGGDEEFPPKLSVLWDANTLDFVHYETTFFIAGHLLGRLEAGLAREDG